MKMNRRSLLRLLACTPFIVPAVVKALAEPKTPAVKYRLMGFDLDAEPSKERGFLGIVLGKPGIGKTEMARRMMLMPSTFLMDDCDNLTDPVADCEYLLSRGINVVAIVRESEQMKSHLLAWFYGGRTAPLFHRADWVIRVDGYDCVKNTTTGREDRSWTCRTLKNRYGDQKSEHQWHFHA